MKIPSNDFGSEFENDLLKVLAMVFAIFIIVSFSKTISNKGSESIPSAVVLRPGTDTISGIQFCKTGTGSTIMVIDTLNSRVGIGLTNPEYDLEVNGEISATLKSFIINHPTKPGMRLRHTSLEGPENGVYIRGRVEDKNVIELPDYWTGLIDPGTITVHLTPAGKFSRVYVDIIADNKIFIKEIGDEVITYYCEKLHE